MMDIEPRSEHNAAPKFIRGEVNGDVALTRAGKDAANKATPESPYPVQTTNKSNQAAADRIMRTEFKSAPVPFPDADVVPRVPGTNIEGALKMHTYFDAGTASMAKTNQQITDMALLNSTKYGSQAMTQTDMEDILPNNLLVFRRRPGPHAPKNGPHEYRHLGNLNDWLASRPDRHEKAKTWANQPWLFLDQWTFGGITVHVRTDLDADGLAWSRITHGDQGPFYTPNIWIGQEEEVRVGAVLWLLFVRREEGKEQQNRQNKNAPFRDPDTGLAEPVRAPYYRWEPYVTNGQRQPPEHAYNGPNWSGLAIRVGTVVRCPIEPHDQRRYFHYVDQVIYPGSEELNNVANIALKLPLIEVDIDLLGDKILKPTPCLYETEIDEIEDLN
jgi:hypothetical protein